MRTRKTTTCLVLALFATAGVAEARDAVKQRKVFDARAITSRWRVSGGTFLSTFDTRIAYSPNGLVAGFIQAEDDLGLDQEINTFGVNARYRLSDRHRLELAGTLLDRTATRVIEDEITWGDVVYDVGATVRTELQTNLFSFKWKYSFSDSGRLDAGLSAGLSTFDIAASLSGNGEVNGSQVAGATEGAAFVAPVPLIGFWVDYAFTPRWIVRASAEAIDLSIGSNEGRVLQTLFSAEYYVTKLVGLGFGLTGVDVEYSQKEDRKRIGVDYRIKSFSGYLSFVF